MHRTLFDPNEIPANLRQYFEEVEVPCLAPWRRVVDRQKGREWPVPKLTELSKTGVSNNGMGGSTLSASGGSKGWDAFGTKVETIGWEQTCKCPPHDPIPAVCLDPFVGSGTTLMVADRLGRDAIGVELNPSYAEMALKRVEADRLARDPILREQAAARAGGWTAPTLPLWQPQGGDDD